MTRIVKCIYRFLQQHQLNTVDEIKRWLPSIKRDMAINLSQSQVTCYTDGKVEEYRNRVDQLHREYIAFVR